MVPHHHFGLRLAIRPRNLPSSSSRLRRGYDRAPRGAVSLCRLLTLGQSPSCVALKIRCRSRRTSRSQPDQSTQSQSTASRPSSAGRSSGPFTTEWRLTCASVPAVPAGRLQRLTCPRGRAFAPGRVPVRYPASYARRPTEGWSTSSRFPVAFRLPAFASWASCPAGGIGPSLPPAYRHPSRCGGPRRGFRVPHA
jgi:hypothetical protein